MRSTFSRRGVLRKGLILSLGLLVAWTAHAQIRTGNAKTNSLPLRKPSEYQGRSFTFRLTGEPETLDWNRAHTQIEASLLINLMEGLVTLDSQLKPVPALAERWEISPDRKTYTFYLRRGVKWSDGVELRAKDFIYSWKRLLSPLTAAPYAYFLFDIQGAKEFHEGTYQSFEQVGVKALNDSTLQVRLTQPLAQWITIPSFWVTFPLRQDVVESNGPGWDAPGRMVNLGPFSLVEHDFNSKIVLKANPKYYGSRGNLDYVTAAIIKDDSEALAKFEAGQVDFVTNLSQVDLRALKSKTQFKAFPLLKTVYLGLAVDKYPLTDTKVRRAIAMALDRSQLGGQKGLLRGEQKAASSFVPPGVLGFSKEFGVRFDPVQAKSLLQSSGAGAAPGMNLDLILPNWDRAVQTAKWVKDQLSKNLGISINVNSQDNKIFRNQLSLHDGHIFYASWTADYPDPDNFLTVFLGSSGNNFTHWKNEEFDRGVERARTEFDSKKREQAYLSLQRLLQEEEVAMIPLYYEPNLALVSARAKNVRLNPLDYLDLRSVHVIP